MVFSLCAHKIASIGLSPALGPASSVEAKATSGRWLCWSQAGLGPAPGPLGEELLGVYLATLPSLHYTYTVISVTQRAGNGCAWGVHLLLWERQVGMMPGSRLPIGLLNPRHAGLGCLWYQWTYLPPSLPGWPSCIPGTLPRICIFEA